MRSTAARPLTASPTPAAPRRSQPRLSQQHPQQKCLRENALLQANARVKGPERQPAPRLGQNSGNWTPLRNDKLAVLPQPRGAGLRAVRPWKFSTHPWFGQRGGIARCCAGRPRPHRSATEPQNHPETTCGLAGQHSCDEGCGGSHADVGRRGAGKKLAGG